MRLAPLAAMLGLVALTSSAAAQTTGTFDDIGRYVSSGRRVSVEDRAGATTTGRLATLSAGEITLKTDRGLRRFARDEVAAVGVRGGYGQRGAIIGAIVGAALCIPCVSGEYGDPDAPVLTGLLGAGAGAIAGALVRRTKIVYRAPGRPVSFRIAPWSSRGRAAVHAVVRW